MNASHWPERHQDVMNRQDSRKLRTLIVSLNARFEHENPAAWYLKSACDARGPGICGEVSVLSGTINEDLNRIFGAVAEFSPDIAAFSCYVWNRDDTLRLCADLHSAFPSMVLVAGGPEASHAGGGDDYRIAGADLILAGEGEVCFPDLLETLSGGSWPDTETVVRWSRISAPLEPDKLFSPCSPEYLAMLGGRIAYVESSRGCPYHCSYCLSSESTGMTRIPLERVFDELDLLVAAGVKVVKFTDRTFNLSEERTLDVWNHLEKYRASGIVFHFEVAPDLLSTAQISLLGDLPPGLVQIEAGIQSTHADTLTRINRRMDVESALDKLRQVIAHGNVHVHADLIAGLPGEGYSQFAVSFDRLAAIRPHHLQLGFLKLLRGTRLEREAQKWGYVRRGYPPYEVIASSALSPAEMLRLKDVEETLERYANSGRFLLVMQWLLPRHGSAFALYEKLADKQRLMGMMGRAVSSDALFRCMHAFLSEETLAAGNGVAASAGYGVAASAGYGVAASAGYGVAASAGYGVAASAGYGEAASAGYGEAASVELGEEGPVGKVEVAFADIGMALLRLDWVCAHRNPFLPEWLSDGTVRMTAGKDLLQAAFGAGYGNPDVREMRNRYYSAVEVLPPEVRDGVRYIPVDKWAGNEETGNVETGYVRVRILIDVKKSNPVLGRPNVIAIPF